MICQTLDWSEFSNVPKLRDAFDRHNCTGDTPVSTDVRWQRSTSSPSYTGPGDLTRPPFLPFQIGVQIHMWEVTTFPLCYLIASLGWRIIICNRKYLLGLSFQIAARARTADGLFFLFPSEKESVRFLNNQTKKKNRKKGIPLDSYRVIRISWRVLAVVEQIWRTSVINPNATSPPRKDICTRLVLVFFNLKQYESLNAFLNHSCLPCWVNDIGNQVLICLFFVCIQKVQKSVAFFFFF